MDADVSDVNPGMAEEGSVSTRVKVLVAVLIAVLVGFVVFQAGKDSAVDTADVATAVDDQPTETVADFPTVYEPTTVYEPPSTEPAPTYDPDIPTMPGVWATTDASTRASLCEIFRTNVKWSTAFAEGLTNREGSPPVSPTEVFAFFDNACP